MAYDSDVDLEAEVGPYIGIGTDDEIWDTLGEEALEVPCDEPEWHSEWELVPYVAPEPPFIECLPRGVDTRVFAEFVLSVRDAGWQVAVERASRHFDFRDDDLPLVRLAVLLVWYGRRNTCVDALAVMAQSLTDDPSGAAALVGTANFLGHLGHL
jgi:hypothetical protein